MNTKLVNMIKSITKENSKYVNDTPKKSYFQLYDLKISESHIIYESSFTLPLGIIY